MTDTLREKIAALTSYDQCLKRPLAMVEATDGDGNWIDRRHVLALLDAHTAEPAPELCDVCGGHGMAGHPDSGAVCIPCNGTGGVKPAPDAVAEALDALGNIAAMGYSDDPAVQANIARMAVEMARSARSAYFKGHQP